MTSLTPNLAGPAKYPLHDVAVILCSRCRERYRLSLVVSLGQGFEKLTCPRCQSTISVFTSGHTALVRLDQGSVAGHYMIPFIPNTQHLQPLS